MLENGSSNLKQVFTQRFNPITGKSEWELQHEKYDFHQEIARAAFADMLHDTERNKKYFAGLKWAIAHLRSQGKPVRVLDIGTGTGLLSLMAAQLGADEITACEAFQPMAKCAKHIIRQNGFEEKIRLISKRSTDITVGPGCDMARRANLLVTEVFDTELIGEGAISTFNHAHECLLEKNCLVIPSKATVYAQIVESEILARRNRANPLSIPKSGMISLPAEIVQCLGFTGVLDLQMSQLPDESFRAIADPAPVVNFDFTGSSVIPTNEKLNVEIGVNRTGKCDAIFFWWELDMDGSGENSLSCAPWWHHDLGKNQPWRDHWMQAVYFPSKSVSLLNNQTVILQCCHDEYSFWFDIPEDSKWSYRFVLVPYIPMSVFSTVDNQIERPICTCGFHNVCNPSRIGMLNDVNLNKKYIDVLHKIVNSNTVCAFFGSGCSWLPLIVAKFGAKKVYVIDTEFLSRTTLNAIIRKNDLEGTVKVINSLSEDELNGNKIDLFLSEPYFLSSLLPWDNLHFWYALETVKSTCGTSQCRSLPTKGHLWAVGMDFLNLWKIRAALNEVEGFKMQHFDQIIQNSSHIADHTVEPHHLWEYEGTALTEPFKIFTFDMTQPLPTEELNSSGNIPFLSSGTCNGIALWMEWFLDETTSICRGPISPISPSQKVSWDSHSKQAVYFFSHPKDSQDRHLSYSASFKALNGALELRFSMK